MKQLFTTLFLTCLVSGSFFAQTIQGDGGVPKTYKQTLNTKDLDTWVFDKPDITALQAEDAINDPKGEAPCSLSPGHCIAWAQALYADPRT